MIYADAKVIIRLLEGDATARTPLEARLLPLRGTGGFLATSRLTELGCRVKPPRDGDLTADRHLAALYRGPGRGPLTQMRRPAQAGP